MTKLIVILGVFAIGAPADRTPYRIQVRFDRNTYSFERTRTIFHYQDAYNNLKVPVNACCKQKFDGLYTKLAVFVKNHKGARTVTKTTPFR
ncbi:MAG: hypothetical protein HYR96_04250 [Deltaproteobacteria bacterium]|nr:hypothetical protein [Deltaproteobacteria bacterium]MBI3294594.1 hypothetical protein [Deltaproteobacteria bacterium]